MVRDVKQNPDLEKIQKEIATKLGLSIPENHTLAERAPKLGDRIKDMRILVVLDDVWEQIDMLAIGLPRLLTCKLVLTCTCRSRKDLSMDMRTQKDIPLDFLNEEEAWSLFEKMAGDVVNDISIRSMAIEVAKKLKHLHLQNNVDFTRMIDRKVVFPNLTALSVNSCDDLEFLFSISMAKSLVELKHLKVSSCKIMKEIVSTRDQFNEETIDNIFCKLESLTLDKLPYIARFCTKSSIEFPPEKKFDTWGHPYMILGLVKNLMSRVKFPSLEKLEIIRLRKLQTIWNNLLANQDSFCRLKEVDVSHCNCLMNMFVPIMMGRLNALETLCIWNCKSLEVVFEVGGTDVEERHADTLSPHQSRPFYCQSLSSIAIYNCKSLQKIFPALVAKGLHKLSKLTLGRCDEVEEIIGGEEGLETTSPQFVFPEVTKVRIYKMRKLSRFYPGMHASKWPLLKNLYVYKCDKVKIFAAELPIFQKKYELDPLIEHSFFLIDKDSFPNLEELSLGRVGEIWYGPSSPAPFFSKLKSIEFRNCVCTPFSKQAALLFLQKLHNLDKLEVYKSNWEEIFVNEEEMNSGGGDMEIHAVGTLTLTLPRVKHLQLSDLMELLHLGNHNSQPAGPLFPNLETLEVSWCRILKSVESSAISFRNLTTLRVEECEGLEYLTSYYVAKSLLLLTTVTVRHCHVMKEIIKVASNEDDHCEIAFSRLQELTLFFLSSLQGFCSGNCIVRLPSSTNLIVRWCPIELEISSQGVLLSNSNPEPKPTEESDDDDDDDDTDDDNSFGSEIFQQGPTC